MKITVLFSFLTICISSVYSQWQPVGDKIKTRWASQVNPQNVLPEYPRPQMERTEWQNLNGLWDYSILPAGKAEPQQFDGKLLVPFAVESSLSGVQKTVGKDNELWYHRTFTVPSSWKNRNIILHFGAVDWLADVFINDVKIGRHTGGYVPFCFDITPFLKSSGEQKLVVRVWDGTDSGYQPRGKQVSKPGGIFYTSVTGIWQTVWIEPVNRQHIVSVNATPDVDKERLTVNVKAAGVKPSDIVTVKALDGNTVIAEAKAVACQSIELHIPEAKLWTPETPNLYNLEVSLQSDGKTLDKVKSYFAMRKISYAKDGDGIYRLQLNNKNYFQYGPLDQGWWPDGLYTAPTDEALAFDIEKTKEYGYNMLRKHVKVEPARWYYHCDRLGILVWQDMPSGDRSPQVDQHHYYYGKEFVRTPESEANFRKEWQEIIDYLRPYPSIVVWVPFNEAWGQFKTEEIALWTKQLDPSRLVNPASGGNYYHNVGEMLDLHHYPQPSLHLFDAERVNVLGEYGGIGMPVEGHLWQTDRNWGYVQFKNASEVTDQYVKFALMLKEFTKRGFSAAVYTQTTDVEGEVNGLMTYDRAVMKLDVKRVADANREVISVVK
jgi:beta-galactosidase/beta-glucuronidase